MPNPPNITQIIPPRVPLIDQRTGDISREWYRYFYNLYYATGGTNGGAVPTDRGGTGLTSFTADGVMYASDTETLATGSDFTFNGTDVATTGSVTADVNLNAGVDVNAGRNVNVVGYVAAPTYVDFNTTATTPARQPGRLYWDNTEGNQTLSLCMAGSNAIQQIGEEVFYRIKASAAITEGQVVMFTGTLGASGVLTGAPATGLTAETASYIMGIATENIANNAFGYVTQFGLIRGINTTGGGEAWVDGQILYYNPAVAGGLTKTVPTAPNAKIQVCAVVYASGGGAGSVFVRPTFGGALGQFEGDVQVTTPSGGNILTYDGSYWYNASNVGGGTF